MGVMLGRQEVGPRALGHRSILALPTNTKMKDRMKKIKVPCRGGRGHCHRIAGHEEEGEGGRHRDLGGSRAGLAG